MIQGTMATSLKDVGCMAYIPMGWDINSTTIYARCGKPVTLGVRTEMEYSDWGKHDGIVLFCEDHKHLAANDRKKAGTWTIGPEDSSTFPCRDDDHGLPNDGKERGEKRENPYETQVEKLLSEE